MVCNYTVWFLLRQLCMNTLSGIKTTSIKVN